MQRVGLRVKLLIILFLALVLNSQGASSAIIDKVYVCDQTSGDCADVNTDDELKVIAKITDGTDTVEVTSDGQMHVVMQSTVDASNSTTATLLANNTFTGSFVDLSNYSGISILVTSDVASASMGLEVQLSPDGINPIGGESYTVKAGSEKQFTPPKHARYYRNVYTNGASDQSSFTMHTVLHKTPLKWSSHNISESISEDDDAELVKAVLTGVDPAGIYQNVNVTLDGNLAISDNSSGLAIAKGDVTGHTFIHKFGKAPDFDSGDGFVTVWDGASDDLLGGGAMVYTYSSTANIGIVSSSATADNVDIEIQGLDGNYDTVTQTITLTGTTDVDISSVGGTDLLRVFRMKNVGSTNLAGQVYMRTNGSTATAGVPDTANTVRAIINDGHNQTLMAVYTIPNGKTGYMRDWYAGVAGAVKTSAHVIHVEARPFGQVFQLKHASSVIANGTSHIQHKYIEPEIFVAKTDIEIHMNTDTNVAAVAAGFDIVLVDD